MIQRIKGWPAIITLIILLASTIITVVAFAYNTRADVAMNEKDIIKLQDGLDKTNSLNTRITVLETNYNHISESLDKIDSKIDTINDKIR